MNRSPSRAATLAFGAAVLFLMGSAAAAMPEYSKVELVQGQSGCMGPGDYEQTILTQRGDGVFVAINAGSPRDSELVTSRLPAQVYATFWDSLMALRFLYLDSNYRATLCIEPESYGHIAVEYSRNGRTYRKIVSYHGNGGFPERFQQALHLASGMRVWGELSVERLLDDTTDAAWEKLSDVMGYGFDPRSPMPKPVRYLVASNRSPEMVRRIFDRAVKTNIGRDYMPDFWGDDRARLLAVFLPKDEAAVREGLTRPESIVRFLALSALQFGNPLDLASVARLMTHDGALMVRLYAARILAYSGDLHDASVLLEGLQAGRQWLDAVISAIVASGDSGAVDSLLSFALRGPPEVRQILVSEDAGRKLANPRMTSLLLLSFREARSGFDRVGVLSQTGFRASDTVLLDSVDSFLMSDTGTWNREFAATAMVRLAQHDRPRSLRVLREALRRWPDDLSLVVAVGEVRDTTLYAQLTEMAASGVPRLRAASAYALAHFGTAAARYAMRAAIGTNPVEWYAVKAFCVWPDARSYSRLVQVAGDTASSSTAQWWAVKALGKLGDPRAVPVLQGIADHGDGDRLSKAARDAITEIKGPRQSGRRP